MNDGPARGSSPTALLTKATKHNGHDGERPGQRPFQSVSEGSWPHGTVRPFPAHLRLLALTCRRYEVNPPVDTPHEIPKALWYTTIKCDFATREPKPPKHLDFAGRFETSGILSLALHPLRSFDAQRRFNGSVTLAELRPTALKHLTGPFSLHTLIYSTHPEIMIYLQLHAYSVVSSGFSVHQCLLLLSGEEESRQGTA